MHVDAGWDAGREAGWEAGSDGGGAMLADGGFGCDGGPVGCTGSVGAADVDG